MTVVVHDLRILFDAGTLGGLSDGQLLDRFVERREEAVFEVIVRRHGPMVWGVCRRVLRDHHDAEDAFQATFLVLARRAASVREREKLGNWLYGVAHQTAMKAKAMRAKRQVREVQVPDVPEPVAAPDNFLDDLAESLDRELRRLPEKYRIPIVLCELEGKSHKEAAEQLDWPIGTVSSRLSRARSLLARRLSRPGMALSGGSLAVLLAQESVSASMPTHLIASTARAASLFAAGGAATAGVVPAGVAALTGEVMKVMLLNKLRMVASAIVLATLTCVGASVVMSRTTAGGPPNPTPDDGPGSTPAAHASDKEAEATPRNGVAEKEAARMDGAWKVITGEIDGHPLSPSEKQARWEITADKVAWKAGGTEALFAFRVDPAKRPNDIDLRSGQQVLKGICELDGDTLIVCYGTDRPSGFTTTAGSKHSLIVLKREKDGLKGPSEQAVKQEAEPGGKGLRETLLGLEKAGWESLKGKERGAATAALADDFVAVMADDGRLNRAEFVKLLSDLAVTDYSLSDVALTRLTPDAAVLTYRAKMAYTYKGEAVEETMWVSSGWAKRDGKWVNVLYHESRVKK